ncbi:hypothetical protein E0U70_20150 [Salmonella enterica subsp. enterica serovar Gloucester]|nr:hypothetical protein [Salmonella enterica subsp. enterica serovar Gloucester]
MANKNQQLTFSIQGDPSGLQAALATSNKAIQNFSNEAGGSFSALGKSLNTLTGLMSNFSGGAVAAATGVGTLTAGIAMLVSKSDEYVKQLNEISTQSGLTVENVQKLKKEFSSTGFDLDKYGDWNKDTLDHISDAFSHGGGINDDLKDLGMNLNRIYSFMKDKQGGIKALYELFYEMKNKGLSNGQIVTAMESFASDSSAMIPILEQYNSAGEAWNATMSQSANLSNENAKAYKDYDTAISNLGDSFHSMMANDITPLIKGLTSLIALLAKFGEVSDNVSKQANDSDTKKYITDLSVPKNGYGYLAVQQQQEQIKQAKKNIAARQELTKEAAKQLTKEAALLQNDIFYAQTTPAGQSKGDKDAAAKAKAAAEKAAAAAAKLHAQSQSSFDSITSSFGTDNGEILYNKLMHQEDVLQDKLQNAMNTLNMSQEQQNEMWKEFNDTKQQAMQNLGEQLLNTTDASKLNANIQTIVSKGLLSTKDIRDKLLSKVTVDSGNPFDNDAFYEQQQTDLQKTYDDQLSTLNSMYDNKLLSQEEYQKRSLALQDKFTSDSSDLSNKQTTDQLQSGADIASSMSTIMGGLFGEQSAAYQSMFNMKKSFVIAQAALNIQEAVSEAMALPFPTNIPAIAKVVAGGATIISAIEGTNYAGQFHGGSDEIPASMNNKSFILKAGERVVQPEANKKLTAFLDSQSTGSTNQSQPAIVINAPLNINGGDGQIDDKSFLDMCRKHSRMLYNAVSDAQKRGARS